MAYFQKMCDTRSFVLPAFMFLSIVLILFTPHHSYAQQTLGTYENIPTIEDWIAHPTANTAVEFDAVQLLTGIRTATHGDIKVEFNATGTFPNGELLFLEEIEGVYYANGLWQRYSSTFKPHDLIDGSGMNISFKKTKISTGEILVEDSDIFINQSNPANPSTTGVYDDISYQSNAPIFGQQYGFVPKGPTPIAASDGVLSGGLPPIGGWKEWDNNITEPASSAEWPFFGGVVGFEAFVWAKDGRVLVHRRPSDEDLAERQFDIRVRDDGTEDADTRRLINSLEDDGVGLLKGSTRFPVYCQVPTEMDSGTAFLDYSELPDGVQLYLNENDVIPHFGKSITWDVQNQRDRVFYLEVNEVFHPKYLRLNNGGADDAKDTNGNDMDVASDKAKLTVCGCEPVQYCPSKSSGSNNSLDFFIDLGRINNGESAGYLLLRSKSHDASLNLADPVNLFGTYNGLQETGDFDSDGDTLTAVSSSSDWGTAEIDVVSTNEYDILFKDTSSTVYRTVNIKRPNGNSKLLECTETQTYGGETTTRVWHYEWHEPADPTDINDGPGWILKQGSVVAGVTTFHQVQRRTEFNVGRDRVETLTIEEDDANNTVVSKLVETYRIFAWGEELSVRVADPDGAALREAWSYYEANPESDNYARLENYLSASGYWERYTYDDGRDPGEDFDYKNTVVQQYGSNQLGGTDSAADNTEIETSRWALTLATTPAEDVVVTRTLTRVQGAATQAAYEIIRDDGSTVTGCTEEWTVECVDPDPENGYASLEAFVQAVLEDTYTGELIITKRWRWKSVTASTDDSDAYDVYKVVRSDGQITLFNRTVGSVASHIENDATTIEKTTTVTEGYGNAGTVTYGRITTRVSDEKGNQIALYKQKISEVVGSTPFTVSMTQATQRDVFGRATRTNYYHGDQAYNQWSSGTGTETYHTVQTYGCCGGIAEETSTNRENVTTFRAYDGLGRRYLEREADGLGDGELEAVYGFDAAGRTTTTTRKPEPGSGLANLISTAAFDVAGRPIKVTDPSGRSGHFTYRRVKSDGTTFDPESDTGEFYWESRVHGANDAAPVSVTWTDSRGNTVLQSTASLAVAWDGATAPDADLSLTEHTRSTTIYDWAGRAVESRLYHDLDTLTGWLSTPGSVTTHYRVTGRTIFDAIGRVEQMIDGAGNAVATEYVTGTFKGFKTIAGIDEDGDGTVEASELTEIGRYEYAVKISGVDYQRPWVVKEYEIKPGIVGTPAYPGDFTYREIVEDFEVDSVGTSDFALISRTQWEQPEFGPWTMTQSGVEGKVEKTGTFKNGDVNYELSQIQYTFDTYGRKLHTDEMEAGRDGSGNPTGDLTGNKIRSTQWYDLAGRHVKSQTIGQMFTKTAYDAYGRVEREVAASDEGSNTSVYGSNQFTDDIVLTETMFTYDASGRATGTTGYERSHDALGTTTGLLSAAAADQRRANHSYAWFDANGRRTLAATTGTTPISSSSYGIAYSPNTLPSPADDVIVSQIDFDMVGRAYLSTDNLGRKTRIFFDNAGRVTHRVENWQNNLTTPDTPGPRTGDINRITKNVYDDSPTGGGVRVELIAIDPNGYGFGAEEDNRSTHYIHSGELTVSQRGPIPVNGRLVATLLPDAVADGTSRANVITEINAGGTIFGDFTVTEYFANGQVELITDPRGVQRNSFYTSEGWLNYNTFTRAPGATWTAVGDQSVMYTYGDAGEVLTITAYSDDNFGNISSKITYTTDGFYNRLTESQDHDPTANSGAGAPKTISWAYDTTAASNVYTKAYRLDTVTYPSGRVLQLDYSGHNGIDDAIGRVTGLEDYVDGNPANDVDIVSYAHLGSGRMVRKDYPTPGVRLDMIDEGSEGSDANDDYESSIDAFGRSVRHQWETYDGVSGNAIKDMLHIAHGYDRNSNRLYDERKDTESSANWGFSKVFERDGLERIISAERGSLVDNAGSKEINWLRRSEGTSLNAIDALGNPTQIDRETKAPYTQNITYNDANELETRDVYERSKSTRVRDAFSSSATASDWDIPGSDTFSISGGHLQPTSVTADNINGQTEAASHGLFLWGPGLGPVSNLTYFTFDPSITTTTRAGFVFGYQDPHNYWIVALKYVPGGQNKNEICQVVNGVLTVVKSQNVSITPGVQIHTHIGSTRGKIANGGLTYSFAGGYPAGRVGIYTDSTLVKFNLIDVFPHDEPSDLAGRWDRHSSSDSATTGIAVINTDIRRHYPTFLRGVTLPASQPWRTTLMLTRSGASRNHDGLRFLFNARERDTYSALIIKHAATQYNASGTEFVGGDATSVSGTTTIANVAAAANQNDNLWARIESDGTNVTVKMIVDNTGAPSESAWSSTGVAYTSSNFNMTGGGIGLRAVYGTTYTKHVKVETDADNNGTFVTEYEDDISAWSNYEQITHEHDAAGNMTFDGEKSYTYDSQNRLVKVSNAYRDGQGVVQVGSPIAEYGYDTQGRKIVEKAYLGGVLDTHLHHYYNNWSLIETRDNYSGTGGQRLVTQYVWDNLAPGMYIDSLAQVSHNVNVIVGSGDNVVDRYFYALQDQQYNLMALVDERGVTIERYEYSLYGERLVYRRSDFNEQIMHVDFDGDGDIDNDDYNVIWPHYYNGSGYSHAEGDADGDGLVDYPELLYLDEAVTGPLVTNNDSNALAPVNASTKLFASGVSLCRVGFQGHFHDESIGLIHKRNREYSPKLGRFMQIDPAGYPDGMNGYAAYHVLRGGLDPMGLYYGGSGYSPNSSTYSRPAYDGSPRDKLGYLKFHDLGTHDYGLGDGSGISGFAILEYNVVDVEVATETYKQRGRGGGTKTRTVYTDILDWAPKYVFTNDIPGDNYEECYPDEREILQRRAEISRTIWRNIVKQNNLGLNDLDRANNTVLVLEFGLSLVPFGNACDLAAQGKSWEEVAKSAVFDLIMEVGTLGAGKAFKALRAANKLDNAAKEMAEQAMKRKSAGGGRLDGDLSLDLHPNSQGRQLADPHAIECFTAGTLVATPDSAVPIEQLKPGMRVRTPRGQIDLDGDGAPDDPGTAVNPETWRLLHLEYEVEKADGSRGLIVVHTLQSIEWIEQHGADPGRWVVPPLDLLEMGLSPQTRLKVVSVKPCPMIESGPGRVVLTTVRSISRSVCELVVRNASGIEETLEPTLGHKFWSEGRQAWVSAGLLKPGEQLLDANERPISVVNVTRKPGTRTVYNLTVEGEHVYHVGESSVLVHNNRCDPVHDLLQDVSRSGKSPADKVKDLEKRRHQLPAHITFDPVSPLPGTAGAFKGAPLSKAHGACPLAVVLKDGRIFKGLDNAVVPHPMKPGELGININKLTEVK